MFVEHKEIGEVIEAPAKVLKLSEAIRIGAAMTPQCRGLYVNNGATCAWGAAAVGYGAIGDSEIDRLAGRLHAGNDPRTGKIIPEIMERNDRGESRESIADWLESRGF